MLSWPRLIAIEFPIEAKYNERRTGTVLLAFGSDLCHALRMSTKRTKSEKSQRKADELEKRLDDRPEEHEEKEAERENASRADIDSIRH